MDGDNVGFFEESIYELPPDSSIESSPALRRLRTRRRIGNDAIILSRIITDRYRSPRESGVFC